MQVVGMADVYGVGGQNESGPLGHPVPPNHHVLVCLPVLIQAHGSRPCNSNSGHLCTTCVLEAKMQVIGSAFKGLRADWLDTPCQRLAAASNKE